MEKRKPKGPSPDEILDVIDLRDFAQHAVSRTFPENTVVVREGDRTDSLYIVVSGRVKIYVSDDKGKEIVLGESGPGEYFGEMVLDEGPRSASVMTLEPTRFLVVPKEDFEGFVKKSPEFALHLILKLIKRVRALTNDVKSLSLMEVYGRVARMLLDLAAERDGVLVIDNKPTRQEIARRVGASREMVGRILDDLAVGGYIEVGRDRITIAKTLPRTW
ncbi:MAG TPA: Crp/Fnr family transcriptional regulator [Burkholderiales bacterium]|nr:Crp/Fnr family transcriptional regulator [Burkholderiales bacterium]